MADYEIGPDDELGQALDTLKGEWETVRRALHYALTDGNPDGVRNLLANGASGEAAVERAKIAGSRPSTEPDENDSRAMRWIKDTTRKGLDRREKRAQALDAAALRTSTDTTKGNE